MPNPEFTTSMLSLANNSQIQDKDGSGFSMQLSASQGIGTCKEPLNQ